MREPLDDHGASGGDFLDQMIAVWHPYSDRPLTREDAREIAHNVVGFFHILREWVEEERRATSSAESASPAAAQPRRSVDPQRGIAWMFGIGVNSPLAIAASREHQNV